MLKEKVYDDIKIAKEILDLSTYALDCAIYTFTNEKIEKYYKYKDLTNKNTLCITASGDHILYAILAGSNNITATDINPLAKYFVKLKIAIIKCYDEKYFKELINPFWGVSKKINLNDLKEYLDDETFYFWKTILKYTNYDSGLYRTDSGNSNSYPNYGILKEKLFNTQIVYYDYDIRTLEEEHSNKYDAVFLSNIMDWLNHCSPYLVLEEISRYLTDEGLIYDVKIFSRLHIS